MLSHHHPDHCAELVPLLFAMRVVGRTTPLALLTDPGFRPRLHGLRAAWGHWMDHPGGLVVEDHLPSRSLGPLRLATAPANHGAGARHLRFDTDGVSFVFSGDTGPSSALVDLSRDVDLLVVECGHVPGAPEPREHLDADDLIELVRAARPRCVRVTHLYTHLTLPRRVDATATMRRIRRALPGVDIARARDRERLPLTPPQS